MSLSTVRSPVPAASPRPRHALLHTVPVGHAAPMQPSGLSGWTPGQPTAVIDLGEEFAPDPLNASTAALQFSAAYYAIDSSLEGNGSKKRKVERACDFCRKRKARCDGPKMPDNICSNCITNARTCTYLEGSKPRGPPKAYIVGLEDRVEKMEAILKRVSSFSAMSSGSPFLSLPKVPVILDAQANSSFLQLRPECDFSAELGPPIIRDSWKNADPAPPASSSDKALSDSPKVITSSPSISRKQSLASLAAPQPNRACPTSHTGKVSGTAKPSKAAGKRRQPSGYDSPSNSDDASSSSLSDSSEVDELGELSIVRGMKRLTLRGLEPAEGSPERYLNDNQLRFHGKSSSFKLISHTRELMQRHIVETSSDGRQSNSPADIQLPSSTSNKRPEFWTLPPWEKTFENADDPTRLPDWLLPAFPPPDLADKLISDYFNLNNSTFSLLHRPTFERQWQEKLYTTNAWFACVCLAIFGVASRWSSDPRVLPDEVADKATEGSDNGIWTLAGWQYIAVGMKIHETRRSVMLPPELFEIQSFSLIGLYFRGTVAQHGSWFYLSVGVLKAQDIGAHRRKIYGRKPTVEEELWKRAYWHLVAFDRIGSMLIGRPCCSREEDLDLDLPLEVDDEFWENEDPELAFRQPDGKPALVSCFVHWIKLSHVVAYALKTLYTPSKSKPTLGLTGADWKEETVQKLNDALLKWLDELPDHLRWRPDMEDRIFASQAATLYSTYHLVQILIYRPFIHIPRGRSLNRPYSSQRAAFSQKSLSICLNSARAAAYILDVQTRRGMLNITNVIHVSFVCAGVLLVRLWDLVRQYGTSRGTVSREGRAQIAQEISSIMNEIGDVMARLEEVSPKWEIAREMLDEIKDALPNSPTGETSPGRFFPEDHVGSSYESNLATASDSPVVPLRGYGRPQPPPLAPPDTYDRRAYIQEYISAPQPSLTRRSMATYEGPSSQAHLSFRYGDSVPQLWDMDGAPASPPPLLDFNFFPSHPPSQRFVPLPPPGAKTHDETPIYIPSQPMHHPTSIPHQGSIPSVAGTDHRGAPYHSVRPPPPQPHPIRTNFSRGYQEGYHQHSPHDYGPHTSSTRPLPSDYRSSYCKHEDDSLGDHECLRLRLLEEAYRSRSPPGPPLNPGSSSGGAYGSLHHSPDQWANSGYRWS
ncbi:transcription factor [Ganoderma sinense ZZ0214-1]|uniref:Transcription factor n=1 Tax=Ganoderma sinense ZZ0214-1 TaxID=1077348 RepID=A0A2G8SQR0_9APHY|nr:transcription factor [Ganoderma sinense ZZ0214-1]